MPPATATEYFRAKSVRSSLSSSPRPVRACSGPAPADPAEPPTTTNQLPAVKASCALRGAGVKPGSPAKRGRSEATRLEAGEHKAIVLDRRQVHGMVQSDRCSHADKAATHDSSKSKSPHFGRMATAPAVLASPSICGSQDEVRTSTGIHRVLSAHRRRLIRSRKVRSRARKSVTINCGLSRFSAQHVPLTPTAHAT
jgi:hypothetical protein